MANGKIEYKDISWYLGSFKKDANGEVWYTFEHPSVNDWHPTWIAAPDVESFGTGDDAPLAFAAWQAIVAFLKAVKE